MREMFFTPLRRRQLVASLCLVLFPEVNVAQFTSLMASLTATSTASVTGSAPAGCSTNRPEPFNLAIVNNTDGKAGQSSGSASTGAEASSALDATAVITLTNGTMVDTTGRTLYVSKDGVLTFQEPPLVDQLYTEPFSICANSSLALGATTNWLECSDSSGNATIYYLKPPDSMTCHPILIQEGSTSSTSPQTTTSTIPTTSTTSSSATNPADSTQSTPTTPPTNAASASKVGSIVGGVIGNMVALVILSGLIAFFLVRRRRRRRQEAEIQSRLPEMEAKESRPRVQELGADKPVVELYSVEVAELYGSNVPELHGTMR